MDEHIPVVFLRRMPIITTGPDCLPLKIRWIVAPTLSAPDKKDNSKHTLHDKPFRAHVLVMRLRCAPWGTHVGHNDEEHYYNQ